MIYFVGGINLRVCLVTRHGEGGVEVTQSKYRLTEEQNQEDVQESFDFCARWRDSTREGVSLGIHCE
jgi:hexokinase